MNAIQTAVASLEGGQSALATRLGITPQAVSQWCSGTRPVPAKHCRAIEAATGVSVHDLRPDVFGPAPENSGVDKAVA